MQKKFTSTALAPLASRLLLIVAVVMGHCCLSTLPAHAMAMMDGGTHAHAQMQAMPDGMGAHVVANAPDACGDGDPLMAERDAQGHPAVPVARVAFSVPEQSPAHFRPANADTPLRHTRSRLQVYLI